MVTEVTLETLSKQAPGEYTVAFYASWGCHGCEGFAEQVQSATSADFLIDMYKEDVSRIQDYMSLLPAKIPLITKVTIA